MNTHKRWLFILTLILFSNIAQAQYFDFITNWNKKRIEKRDTMFAKEKVYKQTLHGMGIPFYQNQNFSQNKYVGISYARDKSKITDRPTYYRIFDNSIKMGTLLIAESSMPTGFIHTRLGVSRLNKMTENIAIGGQIAANVNGRVNTSYQNNAVSFEANVDLGPRVRYQNTFKIFYSKIALEYNLALPIVSFGAYGPGYSTSFANNTSGIFLPNKYQRIQSGLFVTLGAKKRFPNQRFKVGYQWDYLHQDLDNGLGLYNAMHTLSFTGFIRKIK